MDGVLIDSSVAVHDAYSSWAVENGLDPARVLEIVHGRRTIEVIRHFGWDGDPELEADRVERLIAERATPANAIQPSCELYRVLDSSQLAVTTSARLATAENNLQVLGLEQPKVLVTGQDVENGKPAPDPYLLAVELLGAAPEACAVIEDSPAGIEAGKAAGCHAVAVLTTHDAGELGAADQVVRPEDLKHVFANLIGSSRTA